jgi:hypothetical protein
MAARKKAKTEAQKERDKQRKAQAKAKQEQRAALAKEKANSKVSDAFSNVRDRMFEGERMQGTIRRYAYGKEVDTALPEEVSLPRSGPDRRLVDADVVDDAARVLDVDRLAGILDMKQAGVNTADPEAIVRHAYGMPSTSPPSSRGPMGNYLANRETDATLRNVGNVVDDSLRTLATGSDFESFRRNTGLRTTSRPDRVYEAMVSERSRKLSDELSPWYEGTATGATTPEGAPVYEEGEARKVINRVASSLDLHPDELRRATAVGSPKSTWSTRSGKYPNIEGAAEILVRSRAHPGLPVEQIAKRTREGDPISGVGLPERRERIAEIARGEHSNFREPITPSQSSLVATGKISNFDMGLISPHSSKYVYSSWVAAERAKSFTSDTHDLGVAGIKTRGRTRINKEGVEKPHKSAGEEWIEKPQNYDISRATAATSLGDRFSDQFRSVKETGGDQAAEDWARANAHKFTLNNAQAAWWVGERGAE